MNTTYFKANGKAALYEKTYVLTVDGATLWIRDTNGEGSYVILDEECVFWVKNTDKADGGNNAWTKYNDADAAVSELGVTAKVDAGYIAIIADKDTGYATSIIIYDTDYDVIADTEENVVPGVDGYTGTVVGTTVYVDASLTGVAQTEAVIATLEAYGFALEANLTVGQTTGIAASKGGINYTFVVDSAVGALTEAYNDADGATVDVYLTAAVEAGELEVVLKDADGNAVAQTSNKVALAAEEWSCYFSAAARTSGTWDAGCQDLGAEVIAAAETAEVYVFGVLAGTYAVEEYVPEV